VRDALKHVGFFLLGAVPFGAGGGLVYWAYLKAGSAEKLVVWAFCGVFGCFFAGLMGAAIYHTGKGIWSEPGWVEDRLEARKKRKAQAAKRLASAQRQDGQLSETTAAAGQVSFVKK
jgi:hypothetical protein